VSSIIKQKIGGLGRSLIPLHVCSDDVIHHNL